MTVSRGAAVRPQGQMSEPVAGIQLSAVPGRIRGAAGARRGIGVRPQIQTGTLHKFSPARCRLHHRPFP